MERNSPTIVQQRPPDQFNSTPLPPKPSPPTRLLARHDPRHPLISLKRFHRPQPQTESPAPDGQLARP